MIQTPSTDTRPHLEVWCVHVRGRVQGVGYRDACVDQARQLGITGWVRNRRDGSVEVEMQGPVEQLDAMARWLADGPPLAQVHNVAPQSRRDGTAGYATFERLPTL